MIMNGGVQQDQIPGNQAYRVEDIARILNVSKSSAYVLVKQGYFRIVRVGKNIRVSRKSFDEWLDNQTNKAL